MPLALGKPKANIGASVAKTRQSYNNGIPEAFVPHGWNGSGNITIGFKYDFALWERNQATLMAATSSAQAAQADQAEARLVLSTQVAQAYAELARLYADHDTMARAIEVPTQTLGLFEQRRRNGLENRGSVAQAKALKAAAGSDLLGIE